MHRNTEISRRPRLLMIFSCFAFLMFISLSCNLPTKTPVAAPQEPPKDMSVDAPVETVELQTSQGVGAVNVPRDYYGPACDSGEEEGAPYRWSVEMLEDPATGKLEGTIKFHACPGGGRAVYRVSGTTDNGTIQTLTGKKVGGGGDLFGTAPVQETFTFDTSSGALSPNLAP